jgi:hypothetical protein
MRKAAGLFLAVVCFAALALAEDPAGTWKMTADGPDGNIYKFDLVIKSDGGKLSGTAGNAELGSIPLKDVQFKEAQLTFQLFYAPAGDINFKMKMTGNNLKGTFTTQEGDTGDISGTR